MVEYLQWTVEKGAEESVECLTTWALKESEFRVISAEARESLSGSSQAAYFVAEQHQRDDLPRRNVSFSCCVLCGDTHRVAECKDFTSLSCSERWNMARSHGLCFRCLVGKHIGRDCKQSGQCGIEGCGSTHHRLLHRSVKNVSNDISDRGCDSCFSFRTIPVILKNGAQQVKINALLDDASTKSYVNAAVAEKLGLHGYQQTVNVSVLNGGKQEIDSMSIAVGLQSLDGRVDRYIMANTADSVTGDIAVVNWCHEAIKWPHLKDIHFPELPERSGVDLLIGLDHPDLHSQDVTLGESEEIQQPD